MSGVTSPSKRNLETCATSHRTTIAVSAIGFVRISTAKAARLKSLDDLDDDDDDEGDGDDDDAGVGLPRVDLVFDGN